MSDHENSFNDAMQPGSHCWVLWHKFTSGDELSQTQREALRSALRNDEVFRHNAIGEQTVDQLLRIESETREQSEAFVARVLAKCNSLTAETNQEESSGPSSIIKLDRDLLTNIHKDRHNTRRENASRQRWFAIAASILVSLAGTGYWLQRQFGKKQSNTSIDHLARPKEAESSQERSDSGTPQASVLEGIVDKHAVASDDIASTNQANSIPNGNAEIGFEQIEKSKALATVTDFNKLGETTTISKGLILGQEIIEIDRGEIFFCMSGGATVNAFAPCRIELISGDSLRLITGELSISVPNETAKFQLLTKAISITNPGCVFDVMVEKSGRTEVEVRRGGIAVETLDYPEAQAWDLNAEETNLLTIFTSESNPGTGTPARDPSQPPRATIGPIASLARSLAGESKGVITFNGQSRSFDDETVFTKVREHVFSEAKVSSNQLAKNWSQFVETATSQPQPAGSIKLNGKEYPFDNYNEAVLAQNNVLAQFAPLGKSEESNAVSDEETKSTTSPPVIPNGFQGSLFIRGERRDFSTFEEYQSAIKELMGPAAEFGFFPFRK